MSLDNAHNILGWPDREEILRPSGAGASVFARLASEKLGRAISHLPGCDDVRVGVLASDPDSTESPLAVVCEFSRPVSVSTLFETQRLAWNFCRTLLLITVEPNIIRKWSCCETPFDEDLAILTNDPSVINFDDTVKNTPEILPAILIDSTTGLCLDEQAAQSLSWVELVSGHFFQENSDRFPQDQRADYMLLSNLTEVRSKLRKLNLDDQYSHDLLARIIFVQFLFDRKDSEGHAALNDTKLDDLHTSDKLSSIYSSFADLLANYEDTYSFFRWLNERFNGDLFPGKGETPEAREAEWQEERNNVKPIHLELLAHFVRGELEMKSGQLCLWPQYSFDAIPLEFISSIYEEFVSGEGTGIHYTPSYVVDLMLDRVLPWASKEWDLRIIDPSCGSGIFLVKAYQRLIYRWKYAHQNSGKEITIDVLQKLLTENLFGVDIDKNAVRVASFSLYLAMCDEIDPKRYWSDEERVRFPVLRDKRIVYGDFFLENRDGFRTFEDAKTFDLVIGNPPWGDSTMTDEAKEWATLHRWRIANNDIGILFLAKSACLAKVSARVCMVQSASALLYNQATKLQQQVFLEHKVVEGVINLAAFQHFKNVRVPTCIVVLRNDDHTGEPFWYECPKPLRTSEDAFRISIEAQDTHFIRPRDVISEPWIWSLYMWGGNRDRAFVRRLNKYRNFQQLLKEKTIDSRQGIYKGDLGTTIEGLRNRAFLGNDEFEASESLTLSTQDLPTIDDPRVHSKDTVDLRAFRTPQLILKTSWTREAFRFQARFVSHKSPGIGAVCSRSFVSIHPKNDDEHLLKAACAVYNSNLTNYYLLLTSGRLAFDRAEPLIKHLRGVPLPDDEDLVDIDLEQIGSVADADKVVTNLFGFNEAETILIDDLARYTLPDYKGNATSPGRQITTRFDETTSSLEPQLLSYAQIVRKVLHAAYGKDKNIQATVFHEKNSGRLPVRMISIFLNAKQSGEVIVETHESSVLHKRLTKLYDTIMNSDGRRIAYQRTCRSYETVEISGEKALAVHIIKPDQVRFWTRAAGLRDGDAIAADLTRWVGSSQSAQDVAKMQ